MVPNISRGYSFKGVTVYLLHDKREADDAPYPDTATRVGFARLFNLEGEARTPEQAAKVMALTVRDAEAIKRDAGIRPGGSKAEAPPVWHLSLSWAKIERPTQEQMERAVHEALEAAGLGVEKGYQTYLVQHTDTTHSHVHVVVNLVHPLTGCQANPHRDQPKLQSWARTYERRNGQIFCHDREAKYAAIDRIRSSRRAPGQAQTAFNDNAQRTTPPATVEAEPATVPATPDRFGRSRDRQPRQPRQDSSLPRRRTGGQQRPEWQARTAAGNDNRTARQAADRIKADSAARWSALKAAERAAFTQRNAEASRFYADRKAGRDAIFETFRTALDGVWKPQPGPKTASPDRSPLWQAVREQQEARLKAFEKNERSALGRVRNALMLAPKASLLRRARLAVDGAERRRLFERGQRAIVARTLPKEDRKPARPQPKTPEPKRVQAERLKAQRTAELERHASETTAQGAAMKARHAFQIEGEKAARAMLSQEIKTAWQQHKETFGRQESGDRTQDEPKPERKADRFGRSRDRQRQPRQRRREATTGQEIEAAPEIDAEAENLPVERGFLSGQFPAPANEQPAHAPPEAAQGTPEPERTADEREAEIKSLLERWQAERDQSRDDNDPGREL